MITPSSRGITATLILCMLVACSKPAFKTSWTRQQAPEVFTARFETARGNFDVEVQRRYSPKAADRFYQLVRHRYFDSDALFYRVVPNYVAQFGTTDSLKEKQWGDVKVEEENVQLGNFKGNMSFASSGVGTRTTTLFINLKDNNVLDTISYQGVKGFPAFGKVTAGMDVVESLYGGYGNSPLDKYEMMFSKNAAFMKLFPQLDKIRKAYIIKRP